VPKRYSDPLARLERLSWTAYSGSMRKNRPKRKVPRKLTRNPIARALGLSGLFHKRMVERPDAYKRRPRHRKSEITEDN
jgi:hypothetical protein